MSSSAFVLDLVGPSEYSHSSSLGCFRQGPQIGLIPSHFYGVQVSQRRGHTNSATHNFKKSGGTWNLRQYAECLVGLLAHLQFMQARPRFSGLGVLEVAWVRSISVSCIAHRNPGVSDSQARWQHCRCYRIRPCRLSSVLFIVRRRGPPAACGDVDGRRSSELPQ